jgi:hypothetical protein
MEIFGVTSNLISTAGSLGNNLGSVASGLNLPAPNILSNYASYNYVLTLSALSSDDLNFPDQSYKIGKPLPIICKSAGADPTNRIKTAFGANEFYINNLTFESRIGNVSVKSTNISVVQFDVIEPYSIGLFIMSVQQAAAQAGHKNWRDGAYLLSIEFRGNTETGGIKKVPFSTRHIPIRLSMMEIKSSAEGSKYLINGFAINGLAQTTEFASLKTETSIQGKTVQEVLQTGPQSLQAVVNAKLGEAKKSDDVALANQIVILFPKEEDLPSSVAPAAASVTARGTKATLNPQLTSTSETILKKIGVDKTTLQQSISAINDIGQASMGFNDFRPADAGTANAADTYDPISKTWIRGKLVHDPQTGTFKFAQNSDIPTAINQILLASDYAKKSLENVDPATGMVTWWRIETQIFYIDSQDNEAKTNKKPKIAVYKIVPYKVHPGKTVGPNTNPNYDLLKKKIVKRYDYIFTGKNTEIINFNIDFNVGFSNSFTADSYKNNQDLVTGKKDAPAATAGNNVQTQDASPKGNPVFDQQGSNPNGSLVQTADKQFSEGQGGGGKDTLTQLVAKNFHKAITNPLDMVLIDLEILGDPYWIVSSGLGNYTSKTVNGVKDLSTDGSVNWQTSEVDMIVNFRSPIDINQITGLYNFAGPNHQDMTKDPKAGPAIGFTGLYKVILVTSEFRNGSFVQKVSAQRRGGQEMKAIGTKENRINTSVPAANGVNAQGQNVTIKNADGSTTNPETGVTTPAVASAGGDRGTRGVA